MGDWHAQTEHTASRDARGGAEDPARPLAVVGDVPRVIGRVSAGSGGPLLVCVGGLHGNEPAGVLALRRVFAALEGDVTGLTGTFVGLSGNRRALRRGTRFVTDDLNRIWTPSRIAHIHEGGDDLADEDMELAELARELEPLLVEDPGRVRVLDLHSLSGEGPPFATMDDTLANRELAFALPVPRVVGLEEELVRTMVSHLVTRGITAIGFECGQNEDPGAIDNAEAAIWITLETAGVLSRGSRPEPAAGRRHLAAVCRGLPGVVEVRHRQAIELGERFEMLPGFVSFQRVGREQLLAEGPDGPVRATEPGMVLMPLYQDQGEDGFFLVREVRGFWLTLSASVRRLRLERWLHLLPGVRRHPDFPGAFTVDLHRARVLALEVFHLLGFRRHERTESHLVMVRRGDWPKELHERLRSR